MGVPVGFPSLARNYFFIFLGADAVVHRPFRTRALSIVVVGNGVMRFATRFIGQRLVFFPKRKTIIARCEQLLNTQT